MSESLSLSQNSTYPNIFSQKSLSEKQFLRFCLEPKTKVMLPLGQVTEVLKIGVDRIVPIPQMPAWVMGVYNWRGNILWTVDLGHLIGLDSWHQQVNNSTKYTAIVISPDREKKIDIDRSISLGLIVTDVEDMQWCNTDLIQSPPASAITTALAPFLTGYWLEKNGDMILALEGNAIVNAMPKNFINY